MSIFCGYEEKNPTSSSINQTQMGFPATLHFAISKYGVRKAIATATPASNRGPTINHKRVLVALALVTIWGPKQVKNKTFCFFSRFHVYLLSRIFRLRLLQENTRFYIARTLFFWILRGFAWRRQRRPWHRACALTWAFPFSQHTKWTAKPTTHSYLPKVHTDLPPHPHTAALCPHKKR